MQGFTVTDIMKMASMSPGFRFCPTDVELVSHYLKRKNQGLDLSPHVLAEVEITKYEPWDLPGQSILESDHEWFFFVPVDRKYPNGSQAKRATDSGFWKATGREREIRLRKNVMGTKRTLVFHTGRAPKGKRTNWIMNEYCLRETKNSHVLCRVRKKQDSVNNSDSNNFIYPGTANKESSSKAQRHGHGEDIDDMLEDVDGFATFKERDDYLKKLFKEDDDCLKNLVKEDDCFEDILNDDIIELDDNGIQPFKLDDGDNFQGSANRRIRLEKCMRRRHFTERSSGDSNMLEKCLAQVFSGPLVCIVCVIMVLLLLLFAFRFYGT